MIALPAAVTAMAGRGPQWAAWVAGLPATMQLLMTRWDLRADGVAGHGHCSVVLPVRTDADVAAALKVSFPDEDSQHEHIALRQWAGHGAVQLLGADPHHGALLLERLHLTDLGAVPEGRACDVVAGLYRRIHQRPLPKLRPLTSVVERATAQLAQLPRNAPIPRRLVEQAMGLGRELAADRSAPYRILHTDLHYGNVLAGDREPWLVIDPKPLNGDPHYELAPMLWNRWDEIAGDVRGGVQRRLWRLVDAAEFDEDRSRAWVLVRMVHNAMWALQERSLDRAWLTTCIAVAKAVSP